MFVVKQAPPEAGDFQKNLINKIVEVSTLNSKYYLFHSSLRCAFSTSHITYFCFGFKKRFNSFTFLRSLLPMKVRGVPLLSSLKT